jgi:hypothetical protein
MVFKEIEKLNDSHGKKLTKENVNEAMNSAEVGNEKEILKLEEQGWGLNT